MDRIKTMRWTGRGLLIVAVALAVVVLLAGCSKLTEPFNDAPISSKDDSPARVLSYPDGFNNVAVKCDGTTAVYVLFHQDDPYGAVEAVPNSPECQGQ